MDCLLLLIHENISQLQGTRKKAGSARGEPLLGLRLALSGSLVSFKLERTSPEHIILTLLNQHLFPLSLFLGFTFYALYALFLHPFVLLQLVEQIAEASIHLIDRLVKASDHAPRADHRVLGFRRLAVHVRFRGNSKLVLLLHKLENLRALSVNLLSKLVQLRLVLP